MDPDELMRSVMRQGFASGTGALSPSLGSVEPDELVRRMLQQMGSFDRIKEENAFLENAKRMMQSGPPSVYAAAMKSPWSQRRDFMLGYNQNQGQAKESRTTICIRHTTVPSVEHREAPSIDCLTRTSLKDVAKMVNHIHVDKVLFVKVIHEPYTVIGRTMLVEDDTGDCITLSLYNSTCELPVNTCLALIAPYMKNAQDKRDALFMLRCDNPQCVVVYNTAAEWRAVRDGNQPPSESLDALELKELGNKAFQRKKYAAADRFYSRALRIATIGDQLHVACLSNRSEGALREGRWEDAERDATQVLSMDKDHQKAKYRLASASIALGQSEKALELSHSLLATSPTDRGFLRLRADAERALKEQNGEFNVQEMRKEASSSITKAFHSDFISQEIEIGVDISLSSGGTYRGCRAVRDIAANELLTASKAFAYSTDFEDAGATFQIDPNAKHLNKGSQIQLATDVIAKLYKRPMLGPPLYKLSSGMEFDEQAMVNSRKIDIPRIRRLLSSNSFGGNKEGEDAQRHWAHMHNPHASDEAIGRLKDSVSGLWITEAMFNHSCAPNCTWSQTGDHMFIRSVRPIRQGEELCISYSGHDDCYEERKNRFRDWIAKGVGFECQCTVCTALRSDGKLRQMEKKVHAAYEAAAKLISSTHTMARAADSAMSPKERQHILSALKDYPLHLQHNTGSHLHVMHGACLNEKGEKEAALAHFQKAADIGYAVRGGRHMSWAKDLWRVVGASLRCDKPSRSEELLCEIWKSPVFGGFSSTGEAQKAFADLTLMHALPWWVDRQDDSRQHFLQNLAMDASEVKKTQNMSRSAKKKGRNRRA